MQSNFIRLLIQLPPQFARLDLLLLRVFLLVRRLLVVLESQVLKLVFRHQVASLASAHLVYPHCVLIAAYWSILQVRYSFAKFLHSGSFTPLTFFIHDR